VQPLIHIRFLSNWGVTDKGQIWREAGKEYDHPASEAIMLIQWKRAERVIDPNDPTSLWAKTVGLDECIAQAAKDKEVWMRAGLEEAKPKRRKKVEDAR
jgi:hypothetical protein